MSTRICIVIFLLALLNVSGAVAAQACQWNTKAPWLHEAAGGVLGHDVERLWARSRREHGTDFNVELVLGRPGCELLGGYLRPNVGITINDSGDTSRLYAGVLLEWAHTTGIFFRLGIGGAIHDGELEAREPDKKSLGSRVLFRVPVELGFAITPHHRLSILFDHISNANLADVNEGLDSLGLRYGYRF